MESGKIRGVWNPQIIDTKFDRVNISVSDSDVTPQHLQGLRWAQEARVRWVHTGATWQIPLNHPCETVMRPVVKLLWAHVTLCDSQEVNPHLSIPAGIKMQKFTVSRTPNPKTRPNGAWMPYVLSRQIYNYQNCAANYSHPLHNKDRSSWVVCIYKLTIINYHIPVTIKAVAKNFARRRETNCETHRHMKFWI